jgi:hypothetical protein
MARPVVGHPDDLAALELAEADVPVDAAVAVVGVPLDDDEVAAPVAARDGSA